MTASVAYREPGLVPLATAPLKEASIRNLKIALGLTVALCGLGLGLFKATGAIADRKPQMKLPPVSPNDTIHVRLPMPPSLKGETAPPVVPKLETLPAIGVPVPVPKEEANAEATATEDELALANASKDTFTSRALVNVAPPKDELPGPGDYVFHDAEPVPIVMPQPEYPAIPRQAGIQGTVIVQLLVDLDGSVMKARVVGSSKNEALDEAAEKGAERFKFIPAKQGNKPVRVWVSMPIVFRLEN
jgi:protein TonB